MINSEPLKHRETDVIGAQSRAYFFPNTNLQQTQLFRYCRGTCTYYTYQREKENIFFSIVFVFKFLTVHKTEPVCSCKCITPI